jgi:hypothetical protein
MTYIQLAKGDEKAALSASQRARQIYQQRYGANSDSAAGSVVLTIR